MKKTLIFGSLILLLFLISCTSTIDPKKSCSLDTDCFPSECCHASDAASKEYAPKCSGVLCTMECLPGTIDCGQGTVKCIKGQCRVVMDG